MRQFVLFVILFIGFYSYSEEPIKALTLEYGIDSVTINPNLEEGQSRVVVSIKNKNIKAKEKILYGYEQESLEAHLNEDKSFEFVLDSGIHVFQFYAAEKADYAEITTFGGIHVTSGTTTYMSLVFREVNKIEELHVRKPVIYLYPAEKTDITVSVQPKGEMSFTYPKYTDKWECTAFPSGEILIEDKAYNYLFWESEQTVNVNQLNELLGLVVLKEDLLDFLKSSLEQFGFNSKESMDFITFWAPHMLKFEATEIHFMFNEECTLFADLEIEPKPDNLLRFYMIWNPMDTFYYDSKMKIDVPKQSRNGFTVLEWGGMEIPRGTRLESQLESTSVNN